MRTGSEPENRATQSGTAPDSTTTEGLESKAALRRRLTAARRSMDEASRAAQADAAFAALLDTDEFRNARTVASYVSLGAEPDTSALHEYLRANDTRVIVPVVRKDMDLDWAPLAGSLSRSRHGLLEPTGERLGVRGIAEADVVLVPGVAVDPNGMRLGRGAGCYDRALARVGRGAWLVALMYPAEFVDRVPAEPHDRPVHALATTTGLHRFPRAAP